MMGDDTIMKQFLRKGRLVSILLASMLLVILLMTWGNVFADGGSTPSLEDYPACSSMKAFQIAGRYPGSACKIPVTSKNGAGSRTIYRSGWTHHYTSESDSDLVEDQIKVDGYLYWWVGYWSLDDHCQDNNSWSSHAACRTYGGGSQNKQNGYHYFHKSGYTDTSFMTTDFWS